MIKSIAISNFQSHKDTTLNFHEGVNVIVGNSDSGKSAILRALKWVLANRPSGDEFRSHWGGDTLVKIDLGNGIEIDRNKSKAGNNYTLWEPIKNSTKIQQQVFKAMGTSVPDEIIELLNMNTVNIQFQGDPHFLLSDTPGQVAQYLNRIVGLDAIDRGMSNIAGKARENTRTLKYEKGALDTQVSQLENYADLNDMDEAVVELEGLEAARGGTENDINRLAELLETIENVEQEAENSIDYGDAEAVIIDLLHLQGTVEDLQESHRELLELVADIETDGFQLTEYAAKLQGLKADYTELMPDECPLCEQEIVR